MPHLLADAIVCAVLSHGEHGAVVRVLTRDAGLQAGYVRGGRSRRLRPVLIAGNRVQIELRTRTAEQLAHATVELARSCAPILGEPLAAAAIEWAASLTAAALPEGQPYPALYDALAGLLDAIEAAPAARGWAQALARYELLLLGAIGFGLDLMRCVVSGSEDDLAFVSPRSAGAVSRAAAVGYEDRLLALPAFLRQVTIGCAPEWSDILTALALTGHFLRVSPIAERRVDVLAARDRLVARLKRTDG